MDPATFLRIVTIIAWGIVFFFMIPGAWSAFRGRAVRRGDPMRLGVLAVAFLFVSYGIRSLVAPDFEAGRVILNALSLATAVYVWRSAHAYGRGPRL